MVPLVSILIPAYNAEKWIGDTLRSALGQTWPNKEIIVVDDGSGDNTPLLARRFESSSVKVVTQLNQGASAARNRALSISQGQYLQWLDADDLLAPDKIEKQMEAAEQCGSARTLLSSAWGTFMYRVSKARFTPTPLWHDLSPLEWLVRKMEANLHMQTATWLVSRELTEAAGPWNIKLSLDDDGEYFCRVILHSQRIRFVDDAKVFYRHAAFDSLSNIDRSDKKLQSQFHSIKLQVCHTVGFRDSQAVRSACIRYLQTWLKCFEEAKPDLAQKLRELAASLGGRLETPQLRRKYRWLQPFVGRRIARQAQYLLPRVKWTLIGLWDRALLPAEERQFRKSKTCRHA